VPGQYKYLFLFIIAFAFLLFPMKVLGHSTAVSISPAPNSNLEVSPDRVTIEFQSEIDEHLYALQVLNDKQQEVTLEKAVVSNNKKELTLLLPRLSPGVYTVTYNIITAYDGHRLQETYQFSIGKIVEGKSVVPSKNSFQYGDITIYLIRIVYYFGLLWIIGWVFWKVITKRKNIPLPKKFEHWGFIAQIVHLMGLISMILLQIIDITNSGLTFSPQIPLNSIYAFAWIGLLCLSIIGFVSLFKSQWFDVGWILLIALFKGVNSHSFESEPALLLMGLDLIHLVCASIWCSGIIFALVFWKKQRLYVNDFLPLFSQFALISFSTLLLTGTILTIFLLPNPLSLFTTPWGFILLVKLIIVLLISFAALKIKEAIKLKLNHGIKLLLTLDFFFLIALMILISVLTYLNPIP
jgi:copper transport protein